MIHMIHDHPIIILAVEDDPDDQMMLKNALDEAEIIEPIYFATNGIELMSYLKRDGKYSNLSNLPLPGLIFLDLNMPKKDGREVLKELKADPDFLGIPVIVLSTSQSDKDIEQAYQLGANSYISKPNTYHELVSIMRLIKDYWLKTVKLPEKFKGKGLKY